MSKNSVTMTPPNGSISALPRAYCHAREDSGSCRSSVDTRSHDANLTVWLAEPVPGERHSRRHRMAAALVENPRFGRRAHDPAKIDTGNRAAGPEAHPVRIESDRKSGTPELLLEARGDKPGYARMPAVARRDDHGGTFHGEASQRLRLGYFERGAL